MGPAPGHARSRLGVPARRLDTSPVRRVELVVVRIPPQVLDRGVTDPELAAALATLTDAEQCRAHSIDRPDDAARFVIGRATLRRRLGAWLGIAPSEVGLVDERGRPVLTTAWAADRDGRPTPVASVAHSGGIVVVASACGGRVGVDVEWINPVVPGDELVAIGRDVLDLDLFQDAGPAGAEAKLRTRFAVAWTTTEALLKAIGTGFEGDPRTVRRAAQLGGWSLRTFRIDGDVLGALATDAAEVEFVSPDVFLQPGAVS